MKPLKSKKGMGVGDLYQFVLLLVLVGMILGVGLLVLDKFATSSGVSGQATTTLNNVISAITPISSTWIGLIVTVSVLSIILGLVIKSFAQQR